MAKNYYGDSGNDVVFQNNQNDYYNIYTYGGADDISLSLTDTFVNAGGGKDEVYSDIEGFNDIKLGSGADTYTGEGFSTRGRAYDIVSGGGGKDTFNILTSHSEYYGDSGRDMFYSAGYNNLLVGGGGNDTVSYMLQDNDSFLHGRGVYVDLDLEYARTGNAREETLVNIENVEGTSFADTLIGTDGDNKIWGGKGYDILDGLDGDDIIDGGKGKDDLYGGGGDDTLIGGRGNDILEGGGGNDTFVFTSIKDSAVGKNRDVIKDFNDGASDKIDLSDIDAISGGGDDAFDYIGHSNFSGTAGELRLTNSGILKGDVDGDGNADFEIKLDGIDDLGAGNFIL